MRRIFSKTFVFFFIFLLFFIFYQSQSRAFAGYTITADPEQPEQLSTTQADEYIYGNVQGAGQSVVTENTRTVHIKFSGLVGNKDYTVCLETLCLLVKGDIDKIPGILGVDTEKRESKPDGTLTLDVCADGKDRLKLLDPGGQCNNGNGDDGDYFWGGHVYGAALYADDTPNRIGAAAFYVSRYYPKVEVYPTNPTPNDPIIVTVTGTRRPHDRENRNSYAVEIARQDDPGIIYSQDCIIVPDSPPVALDKREEGDYIIKINEQAGEGGLFGDDCSAEFTYYWIKIHVRSDSSKNKGIEIIPDPNGADLAGLTNPKKAPRPPCKSVFQSDSDNCPEVKTGVGIDIKTSPAGFVKSIFSLILGVSGGVALLLIIYSGYKLMASRGEPEALKDAKDQLVAAIVGLVFIIFSLVILQIIGVDILKIPGFNP